MTRVVSTEQHTRKRRRILRQPGPCVNESWTVLDGFVIIEGDISLVIPRGGTWPGVTHLSDDLARIIQPVTSALTPGTRVTHHTTPAALEAGAALVFAQTLNKAALQQRLELISPHVDLTRLHRKIGGVLVSLRREGFSKLMTSRPPQS